MFEAYSFWEKLAHEDRPIFLYGTGNGGDKIITALKKFGISLTGVFASDGFVRDRYFHDYHVRSYSDIREEFGDNIIVLLAFGTTLPEVTEFIELLDHRHELIIPEVPLYGGDLFDMNYFCAIRERITDVLSYFDDEKSKNIFCDAINFRLTGKYKYLSNTESMENTLKELFANNTIHTLLDGGAFRGDSTEIFAKVFTPDKIIAVEADPKTFFKLEAYAIQEERTNVECINAALWNSDGILQYVSSGSRGSGESGRNKRAKISSVVSRSIDSIIGDISIDFINLDIEGADSEALHGACETLRIHEPNLAVSLYHRTEDIFVLTERIRKALPAHKLFLRRVPCIPMWDLTLYAVK